ncbi:MAG TPA: LytTR family DNA-binding domain-containing protein [Steroidobacter sp.]
MLTALVVDDEALARRRLAALIRDVPWARQVGEASDGVAALEAIEQCSPDVVFLDIHMPEMSGLEVVDRLRSLPRPPAVIFTTAHDRYAVAAFELEALDYLLKPFSASRFMIALERVRRAHAQGRVGALERARSVLAAPGAPLERIFVREANAVVPLTLADVLRVEAQDDYVSVHTQRRSYLMTLRLHELEQRLPNPPFIRVHRSHIVNLDHVERITGLDSSRFEVRMKGGDVVPVSRARSQEIRRLSR